MNLDDMLAGKDKTKNKNTTVAKKKYKRLYLHTETIELLYDIIYTEKQSDNYDYTIGDAIKDGLEAITKGKKLKKAPESFINSRGTK